MREAILKEVRGFSEDMQLHYSAPNRDLVAEIMQLDASMLSSLHQSDLSKYVFVLGQYIVTLQYNENLMLIDYKLLQKTFEYRLNKAKLERSDIAGKTAKERDAWVLLNVEDVKSISDELLVIEAKKMLIDGMVRAVENLLNALKKEMAVRYGD